MNIGMTGASGGIGQAVRRLLAPGHQVITFGRSAADSCYLDLAQESPLGREFGGALLRWGPFDAWLNLAGADVLSPPLRDTSYETRLAALWAVDVRGTIAVSRAVVPHLRAAPPNSPQIINVAWDHAWIGGNGEFGELYATAKAAVVGFSRSLARTLAPSVRVNVVAPGWVKTRWAESLSPERQHRLVSRSLSGQWITAERAAEAICEILVGQSGIYSGQIFYLDGGDVMG